MDIYYLLEAICENIATNFPNHNIYINDISQGFKRPSFYISLVTFNNEDLTQGEIDKKVTFEIVYFAPVNERGQNDKLAQHVAHINLTEIFSKHALTVKDTRVKIESVSGAPRDNEVYLTIDFNYSSIPDNSINAEQLYDLMQELQLKYSYPN